MRTIENMKFTELCRGGRIGRIGRTRPASGLAGTTQRTLVI
jgi:hypothetical protein